jgi:hypothetical protein
MKHNMEEIKHRYEQGVHKTVASDTLGQKSQNAGTIDSVSGKKFYLLWFQRGFAGRSPNQISAFSLLVFFLLNEQA